MRTVILVTLGSLAALAHADKVVLGRLGQTKAAAQLYSAPSPKAKAMGRVAAGRYLVVRPAGKKWTAIVLDTGRLAYVPSQSITTLAYEVTQDGTKPVSARSRTRYVASRGSSLPRMRLDARESMAEIAMSQEGTTPYKWGGTQLVSGIDCSGFVQKMAGQIGMSLPRTAAEQANVGMPITRYEDLRPGDRLYFWETKRNKIGHTGIYVGGGYFTHSSSGHHGIARDYLSERWRRICVAARR